MADKRYMTNAFYGLDRGERIRDGAFNEYLNMTADKYPVAKTREKRILMKPIYEDKPGARLLGRLLAATDNAGELITAELAENDVLYIHRGTRTVTQTECDSMKEHLSLVNFGRNVFIPELMKYIEWDDTGAGKVSAVYESVDGFTANKDRDDDSLIVFSEYNNHEAFVAFLAKIKKGDALRVILRGVGGSEAKASYNVEEVNTVQNWFTVKGNFSSESAITAADGTIERREPILDYAVSHRNRIWGCRFGENDDGEFVNEIYGSALGDPLNFFVYEDTAADSFTASVGTGGNFTGIGTIGDSVVFFKSDRYYVLSGTEPPFTLQEIQAEGIQENKYYPGNTVCNIAGSLYYKSAHGIMRMGTDSLPVRISGEIGNDHYISLCAGTDGRRYYIILKTGSLTENPWEMYVYDTLTGIWSKQDIRNTDSTIMIRHKDYMLMMYQEEREESVEGETQAVYYAVPFFADVENEYLASGYQLWIYVAGQQLTANAESKFSWCTETGTLGLDNPDYKEVKELLLRCKTGSETVVNVDIVYNGDGVWKRAFSERFKQKGTKSVTIAPPVQCDTYKLRIYGEGEFLLYSITQTIGDGGKQNVVML